MKKEGGLKYLIENEFLWVNTTFVIIFMILVLLNDLGLYKLNNNIVYSFTLGTFLFTLSELAYNLYFKRITFLLGMFSIVILPNCDLIINIVTGFINNDILTIYSLVMIFVSIILNQQKKHLEKKQLKKRKDALIEYENLVREALNTSKGILEMYNESLEKLNNLDDIQKEYFIEDSTNKNNKLINKLDDLINFLDK